MESLNKERNDKKNNKLNLSGKLTKKKKQFHPFVDWQPSSLKLTELLSIFTNSTVFSINNIYFYSVQLYTSCLLATQHFKC